MSPRIGRRPAILAGLGLLSACASAPSRYYQLRAMPGAAPSGAGPASLQLRRVGIPGSLDRAAIVRGGDGARLLVAEDDLWAEPFGDLVTRVLAEDLRLRLPGTAVIAEGSAVDLAGALILEVELGHFEATGGGSVLLQGQAGLRRRNEAATLAVQPLRSEVPLPSPDVPAVVSAMSTALAQAADALAAMVGRFPGRA
ncbi:PqiC family protein [Roseomonas elaeocarpi]|uniref:Membrane integrity-associated transporter subunit PqiC n=1 Tax=Roseomonas elaeocarpi TaxID=907779 RepID=A0ABV6JQ42_9PROT